MSNRYDPLLSKGNEMSYPLLITTLNYMIKMMKLQVKVTMLNPTKDITIKHIII